jgi:hypothetical protein
MIAASTASSVESTTAASSAMPTASVLGKRGSRHQNDNQGCDDCEEKLQESGIFHGFPLLKTWETSDGCQRKLAHHSV